MKILVFGDCHWSTYSSILRKRGSLFSYRLENLIQSMNWVEEQAKNNKVNLIVGLGDFFDKEALNSEEITALKEINWSNIEHHFLIGNHEMGRNDLFYSSTYIFNKSNFYIENGPIVRQHKESKINAVFLPYILNPDKSFLEYVKTFSDTNYKTVIFSHNDIAGIQMGKFVSKSGFDIKDIEECCDLFINGHLHNGEKITDRVINLGNLTGQNFSEDAYKYSHNIMILDTKTLEYELIENPYAINFYRLDAVNHTPNFASLKKNAVITLRCMEKDSDGWAEDIKNCPNIIESRILIEREVLPKESVDSAKDGLVSDHISEFKKYVTETLGASDIVLEELEEVCK
ncbi:MAG: metallophosphoesterase [Methanobrevibacter sp.]|nr:metallophosphoesterase [Methanobrevibacter sp.]